MRPPRSTEGFTLIELMVVATIISISALAFAPSFTKSMADRRAASAASEVARIGRRARAEAIGLQRAHLVIVQPGLNGTGLVELVRGNTLHCARENWAALAALCQRAPAPGSACPEFLDFSDTNWLRTPLEIRLRSVPVGREADPGLIASAEAGVISICYEPSGLTQWSVDAIAAGMAFSDLNVDEALGGGFMFAVGLFNTDDSMVVSVPRLVAFPLGTTPRRLR